MYTPTQFAEQNSKSTLELIRSNPFATLITIHNDVPFSNHIPLLPETDHQGNLSLVGHMARANPQWKHFQSGKEVTAIFHGPHTYITPTWYSSSLNVPTWNYAVVSARGLPFLIESFTEVHSILERSVQEFEKFESQPWAFTLPDKLKKDLIKAIIGFRIEVKELEGKFKLSQNRSLEDYQGVTNGLRDRSDDMSKKVLDLMLKQGHSNARS